MFFVKPFSIALIFLLISGCCSLGDSKPVKPIPKEEKCDANGPPNGEHVLSSSCSFVVKHDQVCSYDEFGRLKDVSTKPSGACLCIGF